MTCRSMRRRRTRWSREQPTWSWPRRFTLWTRRRPAGFELPSSASEELKNPRRDVPFAVLRSGIATVLFYGVPVLAILLVLRPAQLSNVGGFLDALQTVFVVYGGHTASSGVVLTGAGKVLADIAAVQVSRRSPSVPDTRRDGRAMDCRDSDHRLGGPHDRRDHLPGHRHLEPRFLAAQRVRGRAPSVHVVAGHTARGDDTSRADLVCPRPSHPAAAGARVRGSYCGRRGTDAGRGG
jgi:hypothetical protein